MSVTESQDIEQATSAMHSAPDNKTRRYDRQLRLWAASGQAALESSRILVLSASATSTSILKNLVLPGIGHFTLLDDEQVKPSDAGNNFFLDGFSSIGKNRAQEALPLLKELNDSVDGEAVTKSVKELLSTDEGKKWIKGFSLVIAHNLKKGELEQLSNLLWEDLNDPPLIVVRSAGFLADFYIQFHEQCIIEPHSDTAPSLRITKPFPALQKWADETDFSKLDPTEHAHVPFVIILIKAADHWRKEHNGDLPKTYDEKKQFKAYVRSLQTKIDEENFEEAEAQAVRIWGAAETPVPSEVKALFSLPSLTSPNQTDSNEAFHALLQTLKKFVEDPEGPGRLPLTSTLPDMKTDTESYVKLQKLYREWSGVESARFKTLLQQTYPTLEIDPAMVDSFIKNVHHIRLLRGRKYGTWETNVDSVKETLLYMGKEVGTHLVLNALEELLYKDEEVTSEKVIEHVKSFLGPDVELPEEVDAAAGEVARAPTADLPNTAAFLGGMIAQESIKIITKQYVPVNGYCVVDLIDSWTGNIGAP
ncbi:hypothetical protein C8Q75DRAFT_747634 [Abortiporus biennis]|nr:hypothetical protein C8Q75DRAFT_747634 [Abortiporus biennis]